MRDFNGHTRVVPFAVAPSERNAPGCTGPKLSTFAAPGERHSSNVVKDMRICLAVTPPAGGGGTPSGLPRRTSGRICALIYAVTAHDGYPERIWPCHFPTCTISVH